MKHLAEIDKLRIRNLVEKFMAELCENKSLKCMCFVICYPLSLHLKNNAIENTIRAGIYNSISHYWLNLEDCDETIVDVTISQFDKALPLVYIGKIAQDYHENIYCFDDTYKVWSDWLLNKLILPLEPPKEVNIKTLLRVNLKAANLLYKENEQMRLKGNFIESEMNEKYFDCIRQVLRKYSNEKELVEPTIIKELSNFLLPISF